MSKNVKIVKTFQNGQTLSKQVKEFLTNQKCTKILTKNVKIVKKNLRSCLLITLIKYLKGHRSQGLIFVFTTHH